MSIKMMKSSPNRFGIDFGTTRTVVAAREKGNYPVCSFSWKGDIKEYIPSLIAVEQGRPCFGWEAAALINKPDVMALRSLKRFAGRLRPEDPVDLGQGVSFSMLELLTLFLSHVRWMVTQHSNLNIDRKAPLEVMVAVPANANSNQRFITLEAFRQAGYTVLGAMNEPSAAAVEFLHRYLKNLGPKSPKRYVVIYDLGGGTFDTSVIGMAGRGHDVIANEGIAQLGGDDFDEIILDMVLETVGVAKSDLTPSETVRMLEECRERKEGLKPNTRKMVVDVGTVLTGTDPVVLETGQIYERCTPLIRRSLSAVQTMVEKLAQTDIGPLEGPGLAAVYLVGGSIAFPPVARHLRELFGTKVKNSPFPHAAPAIGLAIMADPKNQIQVREAVSRYFGIWREREQDKVFDPVFSQKQEVGTENGKLTVVRQYRPLHNIGRLRYLECSALGSAGEPEGDITVWRDIYFPYDPGLADHKNLKGVPITVRPELSSQEVVETYDYDTQGIVHVEIENRTAGYRRHFRLTPGNS
ncbi:MAG: Hsp70 family protein [Desulfobacterales bacterium]|jgi:molecular chaperone DnaK (HSP70)